MKKSIIITGIVAVIILVIIASFVLRKPADTASGTPSGSPTVVPRSNASISATTSPSPSVSALPSGNISIADLSKNNGKNGAACWVAVNGTVYTIISNPKWNNGQHTPSEGRAYCGADMSDVIGSSPHGTRVLNGLPVVGKLQ